VNEDIGEFLHAVEALSTLPLPSRIPFNTSSAHSIRISSAAAAEKGRPVFVAACLVQPGSSTGFIISWELFCQGLNVEKIRKSDAIFLVT